VAVQQPFLTTLFSSSTRRSIRFEELDDHIACRLEEHHQQSGHCDPSLDVFSSSPADMFEHYLKLAQSNTSRLSMYGRHQ
jgi:hypothetical protein